MSDKKVLDYIAHCNITNPIECDALMTEISGAWIYPEYCKKNKYGNWEVHTCEWSGNKDVIAALRSNDMFWRLYWLQSTSTVDGFDFVFGRNITDLDYREKELQAKVAERDEALNLMVHELARMELVRDELLREMEWRLENKNNRIAYLKRRIELLEKEREE